MGHVELVNVEYVTNIFHKILFKQLLNVKYIYLISDIKNSNISEHITKILNELSVL